MIKIVILEDEKFVLNKKLISEAKETSDWIVKVLNDSPETRIFAFEQNKESEFIKIVKKHIHNVQISFIDENSLPTDSQKNTSNVIGILCGRDEMVIVFEIETGDIIPPKYLSACIRMRRLAQYVNDLKN